MRENLVGFVVVSFDEQFTRIEEHHSYNELVERGRNRLESPEFARTFFCGFDLKKTPSGNWFVVEVNGRHTGLRGLEAVTGDFSQAEFDREVRRKYDMVKTRFSSLVGDMISKALQGEYPVLGDDPNKTVKAIFAQIEYNDEAFEQTLEDKSLHKALIPESLRTPYRILDGAENFVDLRKWVTDVSSEAPEDLDRRYIVFKNPRSWQGNGVYIFRTDRLKEANIVPGYLVEPFIKSVPIVNAKTGQVHDGCMRLGVFANVDNNGVVDFTHAGGYWRLSPNPVDKTKARLKGRYTANYSRGAIAQAAIDEDLYSAREVVEECTIAMLTRFYSREFVKKEQVTNPS